MNAQVTRIFLTLLKYTLAEKILKLQTGKCYMGNENPFGPTFDASIVYGPVLDKCITWFAI
jgi:hypothetical protein